VADATIPLAEIAARDQWRESLDATYGRTAAMLRVDYKRVLARLEPLTRDYERRIAELVEAGVNITPKMVRGLPEWARLRAGIEIELAAFARQAREESERLNEDMIERGIQYAQDATVAAAAAADTPGILQEWNRPSPEAVKDIALRMRDPMLDKVWARFPEEAVVLIKSAITTGLAQGKNPVATARMLHKMLNVPYSWAETTVRTAQLYAYRTAAHHTFKQNYDILQGWMWSSARDVRTCPACWVMDGQVFSIRESLNDHHRGRCAPVPILAGQPTRPRGWELFERLPEDEQQEILGPSMWLAWKDGLIKPEDMVGQYQDDIYGLMRRTRSLREILGSRTAAQYISAIRRPRATEAVQRIATALKEMWNSQREALLENVTTFYENQLKHVAEARQSAVKRAWKNVKSEVNAAFDRMQQVGLPPLKDITFRMGIALRNTTLAWYDSEYLEIVINSSYPWKDHHLTSEDEEIDFWFASQEEGQTIIHELGHAYHDANLREKHNITINDAISVLTDDQILIASEVSGYAQTNTAEFIAETFGGILAGEQYSDDVYELYRALDGPPIPGIPETGWEPET